MGHLSWRCDDACAVSLGDEARSLETIGHLGRTTCSGSGRSRNGDFTAAGVASDAGISLNKTESISLTYEAVRRKRIRCYAWEYAGEYLTDFLNLFRAPGEASHGGASTFIYRAHPSKPNDTLQATNYAHMLGKILRGEPMFADASLKLCLENTLSSDFAYLQEGDGGAFSA